MSVRVLASLRTRTAAGLWAGALGAALAIALADSAGAVQLKQTLDGAGGTLGNALGQTSGQAKKDHRGRQSPGQVKLGGNATGHGTSKTQSKNLVELSVAGLPPVAVADPGVADLLDPRQPGSQQDAPGNGPGNNQDKPGNGGDRPGDPRQGAASPGGPSSGNRSEQAQGGGSGHGAGGTGGDDAGGGEAGRDRAGSHDGAPGSRHASADAAGAGPSDPETEASPTPREPAPVERLIEQIPPELEGLLLSAALVIVLLGLIFLRERHRFRQVERNALRDPLTGLGNRLAFDHQLAIDWERSKRYDRPLGLIVLDLDGFKAINDTRGHAAGDRVLRETAAAVATRVRRADLAARLGGDEFVVLVAETRGEGLEALATALKSAIEEQAIAVSVGWAEREPGDESGTDVFERADKVMYAEKHAKRGRVSPEPEAPVPVAATIVP